MDVAHAGLRLRREIIPAFVKRLDRLELIPISSADLS